MRAARDNTLAVFYVCLDIFPSASPRCRGCDAANDPARLGADFFFSSGRAPLRWHLLLNRSCLMRRHQKDVRAGMSDHTPLDAGATHCA